MAMHFDMYFFHKTSLYGTILVLRTATNEGGVGYIIIISENQRYEDTRMVIWPSPLKER